MDEKTITERIQSAGKYLGVSRRELVEETTIVNANNNRTF